MYVLVLVLYQEAAA